MQSIKGGCCENGSNLPPKTTTSTNAAVMADFNEYYKKNDS